MRTETWTLHDVPLEQVPASVLAAGDPDELDDEPEDNDRD